MKNLNDAYFYLLIIVLFFIDICSLTFFEKPIIYTLLCLYAFAVFQSIGKRKLSTLVALLLLESFVFHGKFGLELLYLIPFAFMSMRARNMLYTLSIQPYILLICCLLCQTLIIEYYLLHFDISFSYTISKIIANIIVMIGISLKFRSR